MYWYTECVAEQKIIFNNKFKCLQDIYKYLFCLISFVVNWHRATCHPCVQFLKSKKKTDNNYISVRLMVFVVVLKCQILWS